MLIMVLLGMSGSGKDSLANELVHIGFNKCVFHTTRPIRSGEENGIDYYFVSEEEFDKRDFVFSKEYTTLTQDGQTQTWKYGLHANEIVEDMDNVMVGDVELLNTMHDKYKHVFSALVYGDRVDRLRRAKQRDSNFSIREWARREKADAVELEGAKNIDTVISNPENRYATAKTALNIFAGLVRNKVKDREGR